MDKENVVFTTVINIKSEMKAVSFKRSSHRAQLTLSSQSSSDTASLVSLVVKCQSLFNGAVFLECQNAYTLKNV